MNGFTGHHEHKLDAKGRFVLPAPYREKLGEQFMATVGIDKCVYVYSMEEWGAFLGKLEALQLAKSKVRDFMRVTLASAEKIELDAMGRALLPPLLRGYGELRQCISVIGVGEHIEIWDSEKWAAHRSAVLLELAAIAEELDI